MAGKLLKYLPKPTSFSIPSGGSGGAAKAAFSGPIVSIIPKEARRNKKDDVEDQEPTSPKVSCIGQIKHKNHGKKSSKKTKKPKAKAKSQSFNGRVEVEEKNKKPSAIQGMFRRKVRPGRPPVPETEAEEVAGEVGRMRRYSSGRAALADFDWGEVAAAAEDEEEEMMVAHSAPMVMGGGMAATAMEKRKEVNLWRRRTVGPPERLVVV